MDRLDRELRDVTGPAEVERADAPREAPVAEVDDAILALSTPVGGGELRPFFRWGWAPLVIGCAAIVVFVVVVSEVAFDAAGLLPRAPAARLMLILRAVITSALLALWAGWYVLRSRKGIEQVRERLRAQQAALAEQAWRAEQVIGLGALSRVLSHEIRGPLHSIALNTTMLRKRAAKVSERERAELLSLAAQVEEDIGRLDGLLQDYMEYANIPSAALQLETVRVSEMARAVVSVHAPWFERREARLDLVLPDALDVVADPHRLRQLLHLMVRYALEAVEQGGTVRLAAREEGNDAVIALAWDSRGAVEPESVFRPFYVAGAGTSGLALAIVRDIVRAHGGEVSALQADARRLEVRVRLPRERT